MNISLKKICAWLNASQSFDAPLSNAVSIDSRSLEPGALFIAISGERFDGHDFISQAEEKGAAAVIASRPVQTSLPTIYVEDTRVALGEIAKKWREQWSLPVIGVTGSCGKTTTKSMIASILQQLGPTIATIGTLNNDIGLPLTVLKLTAEHCYAVFELGANHLGEISYLANIARPTVSLITNAAGAHLEGFGSLDNVAKAKSEIYQALPLDGAAVLNIDDSYADFWRKVIGDRTIITFSVTNYDADVYARDIRLDEEGRAQFLLVTKIGEILIRLPLLGKHHVANALAAVATCFAISSQSKKPQENSEFLTNIQIGLESLSPINKRLTLKKALSGAKILDDSYNANPLSLHAALLVLAHCKEEKILVLGDMGELGEQALECHKDVGRKARELGINALYAVGKLSRFAIETFGRNGYHFEDKQKLIAAIRAVLTNDVAVLVKGSRSAKMEEVVAALTETQ